MLGPTLGTRDMRMGEKDKKQTRKQTLRLESLLLVGETGHKNMKTICHKAICIMGKNEAEKRNRVFLAEWKGCYFKEESQKGQTKKVTCEPNLKQVVVSNAVYQITTALAALKQHLWDFPGGPVKNPSCNAGDAGSIPGQGTNSPHATGQLTPCAATTEHVSYS